MKKKWFCCTLLLFVFNVSMLQAEIYKWVDDNGQVHYSEKAPKEKRPATEIHIPKHTRQTPQVSSEQRRQQRDNLLRAFGEERQIRNEEKAKQEKKEAKIRNNCILARDRLKNYERASVLYNLNEKGERVYYTDAQRNQAEANLRNQINKWCD